jgi:hypothetical protein
LRDLPAENTQLERLVVEAGVEKLALKEPKSAVPKASRMHPKCISYC